MKDSDDSPDIVMTLTYLADNPEQFSRKEMAVVMREAARSIRKLRLLVGTIEIADMEIEGNA